MKNRNVGFLIVGIFVVICVIVLLFNIGLRSIVDETCEHGKECIMYDTINLQTYFSLAIAGIVLFVGLFLIFSKDDFFKKVKLRDLDDDERKVVKILTREGGAFFQKSIMDEMGIGKVKMTRVADKLESRGIISRKRKGMNNILVLSR